MNWIDNADSYICPACGQEVSSPANVNFTCPKCGFVAKKDKPVVSKAMSEQRLIDANELKKKSIPHVRGEHGYSAKAENWAVLVKDINNSPAIDPETLPIVRELREQLARVTAERDAAITDMEALMWFSGEGCRICSHCIEVHKTPYVRLDCNLRPKKDCTPEWRGIQEAQQDEQL